MRLRAATARDLDAVLALERDCFRSDRLTRVDLCNALIHSHARLIVAANRSGPVGYLLLRLPRSRRIARIDSLGVAGNARSRGLGARLVAWAERTAGRAGADRIRLEVRRANRVARTMYADRGYRRIALLPHYYADGAHGIRLEKDLRPRRR